MMAPVAKLERDFRRFRREVRILLALGFASLMLAVVVGYVNASDQRGEIRKATAQANSAAIQAAKVAADATAKAAATDRTLCTLRDDLQRRADAARHFLTEHPQGIDGISRSDLVLSIANQERTIRALRGLRCAKLKQ